MFAPRVWPIRPSQPASGATKVPPSLPLASLLRCHSEDASHLFLPYSPSAVPLEIMMYSWVRLWDARKLLCFHLRFLMNDATEEYKRVRLRARVRA